MENNEAGVVNVPGVVNAPGVVSAPLERGELGNDVRNEGRSQMDNERRGGGKKPAGEEEPGGREKEFGGQEDPITGRIEPLLSSVDSLQEEPPEHEVREFLRFTWRCLCIITSGILFLCVLMFLDKRFTLDYEMSLETQEARATRREHKTYGSKYLNGGVWNQELLFLKMTRVVQNFVTSGLAVLLCRVVRKYI